MNESHWRRRMDGRREGSLEGNIDLGDGREGHSRQQTPSNRSASRSHAHSRLREQPLLDNISSVQRKDSCNVRWEQSTISSPALAFLTTKTLQPQDFCTCCLDWEFLPTCCFPGSFSPLDPPRTALTNSLKRPP